MNANNISFENVSSNSTALPSINKPLATVGGCIGLAACLIGQRYAAPANFTSTFCCMTLITYILLARLFDTPGLCLTPIYAMAVHIALSCTPGIPLGVLSSLKRRIGDFFTNSLMGALAGLLILSTPLHKFLTTTLVFTLVMVPAMISAIATQFLHQDYRLVASTATCGTYAIVLAFSAFFHLRICWALQDLQARVFHFMRRAIFASTDSSQYRFQIVDYVVLSTWILAAIFSAVFQLLVSTRSLRQMIARRREPPP